MGPPLLIRTLSPPTPGGSHTTLSTHLCVPYPDLSSATPSFLRWILPAPSRAPQDLVGVPILPLQHHNHCDGRLLPATVVVASSSAVTLRGAAACQDLRSALLRNAWRRIPSMWAWVYKCTPNIFLEKILVHTYIRTPSGFVNGVVLYKA